MATAHLTRRFSEALEYAVAAHAGQRRKGTELPYVSHLLSVAALVLDDGGSETEAMAGLLHDVVEDQGDKADGGRARLNDVRTRFGDEVGDIVEACTDFTVGEQRGGWRERKERYLTHIADMSESVARVSLADKLHNARAMLRDHRVEGDALWQRFNADSDGSAQLWYLRGLADAFGRSSTSPMVADLELTVRELEMRMGAPER